MRGISIILYSKIQTGVDPFKVPIYEEIAKTVDNVLVHPTTTEDIINTMNLTGKKAVYTIAIPKGNKDTWKDRTVEFFGKKWHVFTEAEEGIEHLVPGSWNKKYKVEHYG